jgi:hypothetical protein
MRVRTTALLLIAFAAPEGADEGSRVKIFGRDVELGPRDRRSMGGRRADRRRG